MADEKMTAAHNGSELSPSQRSGVQSEKSSTADSSAPIQEAKTSQILAACDNRDIDELKRLAVSPGGLISDSNRARAWPVLLGSGIPNQSQTLGRAPDHDKAAPHTAETDESQSQPWQVLPRHRDEDQVRLDVDRSFVYYPNDDTVDEKKLELSDLIVEVLRRQPYLCYFQGYHDICQVFLLVLPPALRASAVARLSTLRIRDFMLPSLAPVVAQLRLIPAILQAADRPLWEHLSQTEPYFALSDTLTMFAHNVRAYSDIARLFDVLLAREQVLTLYVFVQIALVRRNELLAHDEGDMLHFALSKLPEGLDLDAVIADAVRLLEAHPPESLGRAWSRGVSRYSALRTVRNGPEQCAAQSLSEGRASFERHHNELLWQERRRELVKRYDTWQNRAALLTVVFGVAAAFYLRRSGGSTGLGGLTGTLQQLTGWI